MPPCVCIALGCKSRWSPGSILTFHRFPKDEQRQKQWLDSVPIKGKLYNNATLCSLHFSAEDYISSGQLKPNACPRDTTADGESRLLNKDNVDKIVTVEKPGYFAIRPLAINPRPKEVQACLGCLDTGAGQIELRGELKVVFGQLTDLLVQGGSLCHICLQLLKKFNKFRQRCRCITEFLSNIPVVTEEALENVDRKHLKHNYSRSDLLNIDCDPCIPEEADPLIKENLINMDVDTKIDNIRHESIMISDSDNELNEEFETNHEIDHEGVNINDDMDTVDDDAANKTINRQEESDDDFIWPENNDEKLKHRRSSVVSPNNVPIVSPNDVSIGTLVYKKFALFRRLKNSFRLEEDPFVLFERIYKESVLLKSGQSDDEEKVSESKNKGDKVREAELKRNIRDFLDLNDQYGDLLGVDVDFVSLYEQQREMDERRAQAPPAPFCGLCCKTYIHTDTYERHLRTAHDQNLPMECNLCKYRMVSQKQLFGHLLRHARRFICRECGVAMFMTSASVSIVTQHLKWHKGVKYPCRYCDMTFIKRSTLLNHIRIKHGSVACDICQEIFSGTRGLTAHMRKTHKEAVKSRCDSCSVQFHNEAALTRHIDSLPRDVCDEYVKACAECGNNFSNEDLLNDHRKVTHRKEIQCEKCDAIFENEKLYRMHRVNHKVRGGRPRGQPAGNKPGGGKVGKRASNRMCEMCGLTFQNEAALRYHQRVHTGEKPHHCPLCPKSFRIQDQLQMHMNMHTGARPYKCPNCPKAFKTATQNYKHQLVHTKVGRHRCDLCEKTFKTSTWVKTHIQTVHMKIPLPPRARRRQRRRSPPREPHQPPNLDHTYANPIDATQ